eukprot:UN24491
MKKIDICINVEKGYISVKNDGKGIPIEIHKKHKIYVPELIFGNLLTSSNYDDKQRKTTGGRNGYGAKLANIFSKKFIVETVDSVKGLKYKQTWKKNMSEKDEPQIVNNSGKDYTQITFFPDFKKFKMQGFDNDITRLLRKRVYDLAGCTPKDVSVKLNKERINIKDFNQYVGLYLPEGTKKVHEKISDRWEVVVASQDFGSFTQLSFVNSIWTIKGGQHCNFVCDQLCKKVVDTVKRKNKDLKLKPAHVKSHLFLFVNCLIENPAFTSQTKEFLSSKPSTFGSTPTLSEAFLKKAMKTGVCENVMAYAKFRQGREMKKNDGKKVAKVTGIPKLDDANDAGGKHARYCTLILTEGDSAKALAVSGLSVVGRDRYGVFPLKGKLLNVRDAAHSQIMKNAEITNLRKIMGFRANVDYSIDKNFSTLRYGKLMVMTDQDHDGSHIKGLVINFIEHFWPSLIKRRGFMTEFITPIVVAKKGKQKHCFYTTPEYERWKRRNNGGKGWKIKYYKGLGTSTSAEAKEYFSNMDRHKLNFRYMGQQDNDHLALAFSKKRIEDRKVWLANHVKGTFIDQSKGDINYSEFVDKELILFSIADCARSIPHIADGLKPGQRKILFSCFKRKLKKEIKVAQLAGYVSEHSAYHHGEMSLVGTIIGMAQTYVGSNNINLLMPNGQFGTRHQGGKDAASARYIFTQLAGITRTIFHEDDDLIVNFLNDDGLSVEPEFYVPVIPMCLVNGAEGIGTGWSTFIPNYNPIDIICNIRKLIRGEEIEKMDPFYNGFGGQFYEEGEKKYSCWGSAAKIGRRTIQIDELPIRVWTHNFKSFLEKWIEEAKIADFRENHTDKTVSFTITFGEEFEFEDLDVTLMKKLRLIGSVATSNFVLFNEEGKLKRYQNVEEILHEFYGIRLKYYTKRKNALLAKLGHELKLLANRQRFIWSVINDELVVFKKKKKDLCRELKSAGYDIIVEETKRKKMAMMKSPMNELL